MPVSAKLCFTAVLVRSATTSLCAPNSRSCSAQREVQLRPQVRSEVQLRNEGETAPVAVAGGAPALQFTIAVFRGKLPSFEQLQPVGGGFGGEELGVVEALVIEVLD